MISTAFQNLRGVSIPPLAVRIWNAVTPDNWPGWALSIIAGVQLAIGSFYVYYADKAAIELHIERLGVNPALYGGAFLFIGGISFSEAFIHQRPRFEVVGILGSGVVLHALTDLTSATIERSSLLNFVYLMAIFSMLLVMLAMTREAELIRAAAKKADIDLPESNEVDIAFYRALEEAK